MTKDPTCCAGSRPNRERSADAMSEAAMEPKPNGIPTAKELGFDPAALREKYAAERTRRLRADGNNQYQEITGAHEHYNFYRRACFQTQIKEARWDDEAGRWTISNDRGDVFKTRFMIMSSGPLNRPKLPSIPGIEKFKGHTFHTSRWDYDYTGGDTTGGLHRLADQRGGILGAGATAIQRVSQLGEHPPPPYVV